jgi:hypothetical protein
MNNRPSTLKSLLAISLALLIVFALSTAIVLTAAPANAAPGVPPNAGSVRGSVNTATYLRSTEYTTTGTVYSLSQRPTSWYQADAFVTVDVSGTATVIVTPQFSPDNVNWADGYYQTVSGTTVTNQSYALTLSADGTSYSQFPLAGEYLRFKVATSAFAVATDAVTVTIKATAKNTQ